MSLLSFSYLFFTALFGLFLTCTDARLVNVTIDDTNPDPLTGNTFSYAPDGRWNVGNGCSACTATPDPSSVFDGTWHDATYSNESSQNVVQTARVEFNGSAIYVFGVLSQSTTSPRSTADLSFFIDGQLAGGFTYTPPGIKHYIYNFSLYANDSIGPGMHSFELQNGHAGGETSLVLFDYMIYSQDIDDPTPSSSITSTTSSASRPLSSASRPLTSSSAPAAVIPTTSASPANNTRTIVIASVVPSVFVLVVLFAWLGWRWRTKHKHSNEKSSIETIGTYDPRNVPGVFPSGWEPRYGTPIDLNQSPLLPKRPEATAHVDEHEQSANETPLAGPSTSLVRDLDAAPPPYESLSP